MVPLQLCCMIACSACVSIVLKGLGAGLLHELGRAGREGVFAPITSTDHKAACSLIVLNSVVWIAGGTCNFCWQTSGTHRACLVLGIKEPTKHLLLMLREVGWGWTFPLMFYCCICNAESDARDSYFYQLKRLFCKLWILSINLGWFEEKCHLVSFLKFE